MIKKSEFSAFHPLTNFMYFLAVIVFSMVFMNPVCLIISFISAFLYLIALKGKQAKKILSFILPLLILAAVINPLFNHQGAYIITYFPNGNPLTAESLIFGAAAAVMLACVILHFSCYNEVMTSDKFICLFGKIIPSLSLVLSMTLGFVPRFARQFKAVADAQMCMGKSVYSGKLSNRLKAVLSVLSAVVSWSMENAVLTADSMKARGYGLKGRSSFTIYTFSKRDKAVLFLISALTLYIIAAKVLGFIDFYYFPSISASPFSAAGAAAYIAYAVLFNIPLFIEIYEVVKWKYLESKI